MITVLRAPPFATVQDLGRSGHLHAAVPRAGALDPFALALANILVGNGPNSAAVEWGLTGGEVRFEQDATIAISGARARATLGGRPVPHCEAARAAAGEVLAIERIEAGAWVYLAVAGGINVPEVLGSRSTYLPARFGGMEGRLLRAGDHLPIGRPSTAALPGEPPTSIPSRREATAELADPRPADPIAVLPGPGLGLLPSAAWRWLVETEFRVSRAVSRMGYRLEAPSPAFPLPGDLPSAPACVGTIQLPPGGEPIVLMPDGPTVGGYPRIAVVASPDIGRLAQRSPGEVVRFQEIGLREARAGLQRRWNLLERVAESA
jgi:antagonist of KipI